MPQYINGYVAASLKDLGDLNGPISAPTDSNNPLKKWNDIEKQIEDKVKDVPLKEQVWRKCIAKTSSNEPVVVLGVLYERGTTPPTIPTALTRVFSGATAVQLPLMYEAGGQRIG